MFLEKLTNVQNYVNLFTTAQVSIYEKRAQGFKEILTKNI